MHYEQTHLQYNIFHVLKVIRMMFPLNATLLSTYIFFKQLIELSQFSNVSFRIGQ